MFLAFLHAGFSLPPWIGAPLERESAAPASIPNWAREIPERFASYLAECAVHEPEQEAFGDWASDRWTEWVPIRVTFDQMPGFSKRIAKMLASLGLGGVMTQPGITFELRPTDVAEKASKPMIDSVELAFV